MQSRSSVERYYTFWFLTLFLSLQDVCYLFFWISSFVLFTSVTTNPRLLLPMDSLLIFHPLFFATLNSLFLLSCCKHFSFSVPETIGFSTIYCSPSYYSLSPLSPCLFYTLYSFPGRTFLLRFRTVGFQSTSVFLFWFAVGFEGTSCILHTWFATQSFLCVCSTWILKESIKHIAFVIS